MHNIFFCAVNLSDATSGCDTFFRPFRVFCIWKYIFVFPYEKEKEI